VPARADCSGPTLTYPVLLVISINANILKVDLGTKERAS
jgi:hypothetical protein